MDHGHGNRFSPTIHTNDNSCLCTVAPSQDALHKKIRELTKHSGEALANFEKSGNGDTSEALGSDAANFFNVPTVPAILMPRCLCKHAGNVNAN